MARCAGRLEGSAPLRLLAAIVWIPLLGACASLAATPDPVASPQPLVTQRVEATLPNGMRVVALPDPRAELVEVELFVAAGSRDDPPGKQGLAHLVEHLLFLERATIDPARPNERLDGAIARLSIASNASTDEETTRYHALAAPDALEPLMRVVRAQLIGSCHVDEQSFQRERAVVESERRLRLDSAWGRQLARLRALAFPEGHPNHEPVGGTADSLSSITLADACELRRARYSPRTAVVVMAGKVTREQVEGLASTYLAPLPPRTVVDRDPVPEPVRSYQEYEMVDDDDAAMLYVAWPLPPRGTPGGVAAPFVRDELSQRLNQRAEAELLPDIDVFEIGSPGAPLLVVAAQVGSWDRMDAARDFVLTSARDLHDLKPPFDWMAREKVNRITSSLAAHETLHGRTERIGESMLEERGATLAGEVEGWQRIGPDEVMTAAVAILRREAATVLRVKPRTSTRSTVRHAARIDVPEPSRDVDIESLPTLPAGGVPTDHARRLRLPNGMKVVLLESSSWPLATVSLTFGAGDAQDPPGREGTARLAARLMQPPDGLWNNLIGQRLFLFRTHRMSIDVEPTTTTLRVTGRSDLLHLTLQALANHFRVGTYGAQLLREEARSWKAQLDRPSASLSARASEAEAALLLGSGHPAGRQMSGASVDAITPEGLARFRDEYLVPANATLIITGSFEPGRASHVVNEVFGPWKGGGGSGPPAVQGPAPGAHGGWIAVNDPNAAQIGVRILYPIPESVDRTSPELLALLANRAASHIRERLGASYSFSASIDENGLTRLLRVSGDVDPARADEAIKLLFDELGRLRKGHGLGASLPFARRRQAEELLQASMTTIGLERLLRWTVTTRGTTDRALELYTGLRQSTVEKTAEVAQRILARERAVVVLRGPADAVSRAIQAMGVEEHRTVE